MLAYKTSNIKHYFLYGQAQFFIAMITMDKGLDIQYLKDDVFATEQYVFLNRQHQMSTFATLIFEAHISPKINVM